MNKIIILAAAVALCLSSCGPKIQKVTLEPMPMLHGDSSRTVLPFSKDPTVIRKGNEYMMYYSIKSYEKTVSPEPAHNGWDTGIARSTDLVNWTRVCDLDLRDSKGNKIYGAVAPCVKVIDGQIHMFYQRMWEKANNNNIWHATSEDGITFTNTCDTPVFVPETSWSINRSIDAEVYRVKDKMILMFATRDETKTYQLLGMAEAPYGSDYGPDKWTLLSTEGPFLKPDMDWEMSCIEAPTVIKHKGVWYMFYAGAYNHEKQQIGLATSTDGINFTRIAPDGLLFTHGEEGTWNHGESGHPGVFQDEDGQVYLFFQGKDSPDGNYMLSVCKVHFE